MFSRCQHDNTGSRKTVKNDTTDMECMYCHNKNAYLELAEVGNNFEIYKVTQTFFRLRG